MLPGRDVKPLVFPSSSVILAQLTRDKRCNSEKWCQDPTDDLLFLHFYLQCVQWRKEVTLPIQVSEELLWRPVLIPRYRHQAQHLFKFILILKFSFVCCYINLLLYPGFCSFCYNFGSIYTWINPFRQGRSNKFLMSRFCLCKTSIHVVSGIFSIIYSSSVWYVYLI